MKTIKVKFVDFWDEFYDNNFIYKILIKYYNVILSDEPEYLFASCFGYEYLKYDCIRIFYTGENLVPDFAMFDYAIDFEYMIYGDRNLRYPLYALYKNDINKMLCKHIDTFKEMTVDKILNREFASMVVSNGNQYVSPIREEIFHNLSKYKKIASGGRYLNNIGLPNGVSDKVQFQKNYKFTLACENTSQPGYTTEKLVQAFASQTVPIYWGDPEVSSEFNSKSFIDLNLFSTFDEAYEYIKKVDNDNDLYLQMLREPALIDKKMIEKLDESLELFLVKIIDMNIDKAFRRDRVGRNMKREEEYRFLIANKQLKPTGVIKKIRDFYLNNIFHK